MEEALAHVRIGSLLAIVNVLRAHQVHIMFRATLKEPGFGVGPESLETQLYEEVAIPWPEIAFLSVEFALRRYLERSPRRRRAHAFQGHRLARRQTAHQRRLGRRPAPIGDIASSELAQLGMPFCP